MDKVMIVNKRISLFILSSQRVTNYKIATKHCDKHTNKDPQRSRQGENRSCILRYYRNACAIHFFPSQKKPVIYRIPNGWGRATQGGRQKIVRFSEKRTKPRSIAIGDGFLTSTPKNPSPMSNRAGNSLRFVILRLLAHTAVSQLGTKTETRPNAKSQHTSRKGNRADRTNFVRKVRKSSHNDVGRRTTFHSVVFLVFPYYLKAFAVGLPAHALVNNCRHKAPKENQAQRKNRNVRTLPHYIQHFLCDYKFAHTDLHSFPKIKLYLARTQLRQNSFCGSGCFNPRCCLFSGQRLQAPPRMMVVHARLTRKVSGNRQPTHLNITRFPASHRTCLFRQT